MQTTEEGNKLIAEFMGYAYYPNGYRVKPSYYYIPCWVKSRGILNGNIQVDEVKTDLKYHSSWDWLMPVAFKIKCYGVPEQATAWQQDVLETRAMKLWEAIAYACACINIKMVYEAIIAFVNWYNSNISPVNKEQ